MGIPTAGVWGKWVAVRVSADVERIELAQAVRSQQLETQVAATFKAQGFEVQSVFNEDINVVCVAAHQARLQAAHDLIAKWGDKPFVFDLPLFFPPEGPSVSWAGITSEDEPEHIRIGLGAYLRSMWTLLWTAFRHPFTTTVVDLTTGKRLAELSIPFHEWEASLRKQQEEPING